jgi:hypothetical protein
LLTSSTLKTLTRFSDWAGEERHLPGPPWPLNAILLAVIVVSPIPLVALALEEVTAAFWLVLIAALVLLFIVATTTSRTPALFIGVIVLWFSSQRMVVALVAPHVSADLVRLLLTYKEGFYLILVASGVVSISIRHLRGERALPALLAADMVAFAFLGWLALVFIADPQSSSAELTYLRRFAAPVLLYVGGRLLIARRDELIDSARLLLAVAVGVAAFGLIERFVFDITFWQDTVEASTFYGKQVESGLLPENWTVIYRGVPDGIFIAMPLEVPVRRLVSTYLEPTTLSSLLALALLLLVLVPDLALRRGRPLTRILVALAALAIGVAIVATLSRGGMVTFLAGTLFVLAVRWLRSPGRHLSVPQPLLLMPLVALIGFGAAITTFANVPGRESIKDVLSTRAVSGLTDEPAPSVPQPPVPAETGAPLPEIEVHPPGSTADAANKHLRGLTSGLEEMVDHPLGRGLGATGNWSGKPGTANESTLGVVAAQTGVLGFVLYAGFFATVIASLVGAAWRRTGMEADLALALAGAMFGLFVVSWVSESASGLLGNAFYLLFAGWALALASPPSRQLVFRPLPKVTDGPDDDLLDAPATLTDTRA